MRFESPSGGEDRPNRPLNWSYGEKETNMKQGGMANIFCKRKPEWSAEVGGLSDLCEKRSFGERCRDRGMPVTALSGKEGLARNWGEKGKTISKGKSSSLIGLGLPSL